MTERLPQLHYCSGLHGRAWHNKQRCVIQIMRDESLIQFFAEVISLEFSLFAFHLLCQFIQHSYPTRLTDGGQSHRLHFFLIFILYFIADIPFIWERAFRVGFVNDNFPLLFTSHGGYRRGILNDIYSFFARLNGLKLQWVLINDYGKYNFPS